MIACCVIGDGEAETGPLATRWHSNKFLNPARGGAVLPILHLDGYKIAGPTVLVRLLPSGAPRAGPGPRWKGLGARTRSRSRRWRIRTTCGCWRYGCTATAPRELFDADGAPVAMLRAQAPTRASIG